MSEYALNGLGEPQPQRWTSDEAAAALMAARGLPVPEVCVGAKSPHQRDKELWNIVPASQWSEGPPMQWLGPVSGLLTPECSTLLSSLPKCGKTTFIAWLIHQLDVEGRRVLIVSEEAQKHWKSRKERYSYSDNVQLISRPFKGRPSKQQWESFITHITPAAGGAGDLTIFDTLPNLWCCSEENSPDHAIPALMPLTGIMETGSALLLLHHAGKTDKGEGRAARGSNSILAFVDIALELRRTNPDDAQDHCRTITGYGRWDDVPSELVLELTGSGYDVMGDVTQVLRKRRLSIIRTILNNAGPNAWLTIEGVEDQWPEGKKPSERALRTDLAEGWLSDLWRRQGQGVRGDPFLFACKANATSPGVTT